MAVAAAIAKCILYQNKQTDCVYWLDLFKRKEHDHTLDHNQLDVLLLLLATHAGPATDSSFKNLVTEDDSTNQTADILVVHLLLVLVTVSLE